MRTLKDVPFIDISRENLMAANDLLDREQKGELLEMIIDTVLNGECQNSDSKVVNGVFNQFIAVINRKAAGFITRLNTLDEINAGKKQEKEQPKEEPVVETQELLNPVNVSITQEEIASMVEDKQPKQIRYCGTFEDAVTRLKSSPRADWYRIANQYSSKCGYNVQELINAAS